MKKKTCYDNILNSKLKVNKSLWKESKIKEEIFFSILYERIELSAFYTTIEDCLM